MTSGMDASANSGRWESQNEEASPPNASAADEVPAAADMGDLQAGVGMDDRIANVRRASLDEAALRDELRAIVNRTSAGDASAPPALHKALHEHSEWFDGAGNLAQLSEAAWLNQIAGTNLFLRETTTKALQAMRRDLLGPNPSRAEKLLAERVSICWLQVQYVDMQVLAIQDSSEQIRNELTKRQESAQRRLTHGIKQLAQLQKALRPHPQPKNAQRPDDPLATFQWRDNDGSEILRIAPDTEGKTNGLHVAG